MFPKARLLGAALGGVLLLSVPAPAQQQGQGPLPRPGAASPVPSPPDAGGSVEDLLAPPDQGFLLTMEAWQRRIAVLSLALRAAELEVQRAEQERRLRELQVETDSIDVLALSGLSDDAGGGNLPPLLQGGLEQVRQAQQQQRQSAPPEPQSQPLRVQQIRGVGDNLIATVTTDDGMRASVQSGEFLPDGRAVVQVSQGSVTVRERNGRQRSYGLRR